MSPLHRKLLRTLLQNWGQTLAVIAVVGCGIACYVCIHSAYLNLTLTRDTYYTQSRLADSEVILERAPESAVFEVGAMPGVRRARACILNDVSVDVEETKEPRSGSCPGLRLSHPFGSPVRNEGIGSLARYINTKQTADRVVHMRDGQVQKIEVTATRMDPEELEC